MINNDQVLEWGKDETKRDRIMKRDGNSLTAFGISVMITHWIKEMKEAIKIKEKVGENPPTLNEVKKVENVQIDDPVTDESQTSSHDEFLEAKEEVRI